MNIKHLSTTGKSKTLKAKLKDEISGAKLKKYTGMTHKGGIVSEVYREEKKKRILKEKHGDA